MFEMPARKNEFEQLCECLRQKASEEWDPAPPPPYLFFRKAENSLCHLDLLFRVMGGSEVIEVTSEALAPALPGEVNEEVEFESCR